jgi:hypothetical protein
VKLQRLGPALLVPALLVGLTGCGTLPPGVASKVNGTEITRDQVTQVSEAQCALRDELAGTQQVPATSASRINQESLGLLLDVELTRQFGEDQELRSDPAVVKSLLTQVEPLFEPLGEEDREVMTEVFADWAEGRGVLAVAGSEETGQPVTAAQSQQLIDAGLQVREQWLEDVEVETDPRYAPDEEGFPGGGDGSVSKPTSDFAKGATAEQLDPAWLSGLPAGQKCGG